MHWMCCVWHEKANAKLQGYLRLRHIKSPNAIYAPISRSKTSVPTLPQVCMTKEKEHSDHCIAARMWSPTPHASRTSKRTKPCTNYLIPKSSSTDPKKGRTKAPSFALPQKSQEEETTTNQPTTTFQKSCQPTAKVAWVVKEKANQWSVSHSGSGSGSGSSSDFRRNHQVELAPW